MTVLCNFDFFYHLLIFVSGDKNSTHAKNLWFSHKFVISEKVIEEINMCGNRKFENHDACTIPLNQYLDSLKPGVKGVL